MRRWCSSSSSPSQSGWVRHRVARTIYQPTNQPTNRSASRYLSPDRDGQRAPQMKHRPRTHRSPPFKGLLSKIASLGRSTSSPRLSSSPPPPNFANPARVISSCDFRKDLTFPEGGFTICFTICFTYEGFVCRSCGNAS